MSASSNPVLVELMRGKPLESRHMGAIAIADASGRLVLALGDVERPVFPRSAVKALQAIPLVESGAADAFGLGDAELAVACGSYSGDRVHIEAVRSLLAKAGLDESYLACGAHWPVSDEAFRDSVRVGGRPLPVHNNCSGKHAGMLAACVHLDLDPRFYERPDHKLQVMIAGIISETCGVTLSRDDTGVDGCSVPTWSLPLAALAQGFARFGTRTGLASTRARAAERLRHACFARPVLVAGEGRFDTIAMRALAPALFVKGGAEGVHCAALPELGLGIALKIDDGALHNWRGLRVGQVVAGAALTRGLAEIEIAPRRRARVP